MNRTTPTLTLLLLTGLVGCVNPGPVVVPRVHEPAPVISAAPTSGNSQAIALPQEDEIAFYDLTEAYGLKVSLDLVTGRRVCTDGNNKIVVMPSTKKLTVNGEGHAMREMIRWRNGVLYLPGEARTILAENLRLLPIPEVAHDDTQFDGREVHLAAWRGQHSAPTGSATRSQKSRSLPTAWTVKGERKWRYIVIHHSATTVGGAASFHREHAKKWKNGLGYHFVIGNGSSTQNGEIEVGPRWLRQGKGIDGAHAGNKRYNKFGVGVCLVGDYSKSGPSKDQIAALRKLCRTLMARYGIPKSRIFPHKDVRRGHTDCPGKKFPFKAFVRSL